MSFSNKKKENKFNLSKLRLPHEFENWALNEKDSNYQLSISNDFADNSHLENKSLFTNEINNQKDWEKRLKIREILTKSRKNIARNNVKLINPKFSNYKIKKEFENETKDIKKIDNKKFEKQHYEFNSNGMNGAISGLSQQNITLERAYYNDLILLSKQRFIIKRNMEYQQKMFRKKQEFKGLLGVSKNKHPKEEIQLNSKHDKIFKEIRENQETEARKGQLIRPISVSGQLAKSYQNSFQANSDSSLKQVSAFCDRPKTSEPYFYNSAEKVTIKNLKKSSPQSEYKKPLEDKRFTEFLSSMNYCYYSNIKPKEKHLSKSPLEKIINKNEYLKDYKYEKFDGAGSNQINIKKKIFERLATFSEYMM